MSTDLLQESRLSISLIVLSMTLTTVVTSTGQDKTEVTCYNAVAWDTDNDGYAAYKPGARGKIVHETPQDEMFSCKPGYVRYAGDCNDNDSDIHPFRAEVAFNNKDDNCNGRVDETTFAYWKDGREGNQGIMIQPHINDRRIQNAPNLHYEVSVSRLSNSANWQTRRMKPVQNLRSNRFDLFVDGLSPGTVYRFRVQFYAMGDGDTPTKVGRARSDTYFTSTKGSSDFSNVRTRIVNRAIYEWDQSNRGKVGYRGTVDEHGHRYGARKGENWCSELYTWVVGEFVRGMSGITNVPGLTGFFRKRNQYLANSRIEPDARRGDYVPMDVSGEDGKKDHSGMFLAYDDSRDGDRGIWTLEGNLGDHTRIMFRNEKQERGDEVIDETKMFRGFGRITRSMLK